MPSDVDALRRWLDDMRYHITLARTFAEGMSYDVFCGDLRTTYAVTRCLEIISEASRRLPDEIKSRHPEIPWIDMANAGNIYRHQYHDVHDSLIWRTIEQSLKPLRVVAVQELERLPE